MKRLRFLFLAVLLSLSLPAYASSLSAVPPTAAADTAFSLPIYLDTDSENLNAVEGVLAVPDGIDIESVTAAGSALTVFVHPPSYTLADHAISFTGGTPGGIAPHSHVLLFTLRAHANASGTYVFKPTDFIGYRNDGTGTGISIATAPLAIVVGVKGSAPAVSASTNTQSKLTAEVGKDASLFDGQYFAILSGGDAGTGIDHYEVREGWFVAPVTSDRFYVLHDQKLEHTLQVTAVNHDGRTVTTYVLAPHPLKELAMLVGALLIVLVAGGLLLRMLLRRPRI